MKEYDFIIEYKFDLTIQAKRVIEKSQNDFQPTFVMMLIIGIALCILSPLVFVLELALGLREMELFYS